MIQQQNIVWIELILHPGPKLGKVEAKFLLIWVWIRSACKEVLQKCQYNIQASIYFMWKIV